MSALLTAPVAHSAPGQYLGFALQPVRMCFHLLRESDGSHVSLEYLDDVAIHHADGSVVVEQAKSALSHNPLSNWSGDLWKTIANWLHAIHAEQLDISKTYFHLYVTPAKTGKFASLLNAATTTEQVRALTKQIRKSLTSSKTVPACMPYLEVFLNASDEARVELVKRMSVVSCDNDPLDALRVLVGATVPDPLIDSVCGAALGMVMKRVDQCLRTNNPALISVREFKKVFHAFVQKNNLSGYLSSFTPKPGDDVLQQTLLGRPDFVRQLQFVDASTQEQLRAVSDFLRTSADKTDWAELGLVFDGGFSDLNDTLLRHHGALQGEINDLHSTQSDIVRGRTVYRRCSVLQLPMDGRELPGHFTHGCFNALADDGVLGWHPHYKELLDEP